MLCPYCGAENTEEASFCASCGFDMTENINETESTPQEVSPAGVEQMVQKLRSCFKKYRRFLFAALGVIFLAISIGIFASVFDDSNGYHPYSHHIMVELVDGEVVILQDADKAKPTGLEAQTIVHHQTNMDGSVVAFLTDRAELAVIQRNKLTVVAENVRSFVLSVDGTGLGYVMQNKDDSSCTLALYNIKTKKAKTVTDQYTEITYDLAPDGDSIAYYGRKDGEQDHALMFFNGSKNIRITASEVTLVGLSNNGKYIYATAHDDNGVKYLYCYNKKGQRQTIGQCNIFTVFFNDDHTQILYYNVDDGYRTYISAKGGKGNKIASSVASPLIPNSSKRFEIFATVTVPADDLYNKVYVCTADSGYNVWYIRKDSADSVKLVSGVTGATLSEDGEYVYYMDDNALKVLKVSHKDRAADKSKVLAEDVQSYVVTSDGKKLYYLSDSSLYSVNAKTGKGRKTVANDDVEYGLHINANDIVYYMIEDDVYASKNGRKGKIVLSDAEFLHSAANGIVYVFMNDDSLYATVGAKKPTLVWSND